MGDDNTTIDQQNPFQIGDFRVDPGLNRIEGPNGARPIEPKAMQVLCVLYRNAGETVSREQLLQEVWAGRIVVEETLTRTISQLRQAFGDGKQQPRYIQTVPKRGYRLIAAVDAIPGRALESGSSGPNNDDRRTRSEYPLFRWWPAVIVASVLVLVMAIYLIVPAPTSDQGEPGNEPPSVAVLPFKHLGSEPEGAYLADGVAEELINALASVPGLRVPSRHSSFAFQSKDLSLAEISDALGVRHILEGSVRRSGNDLRISARLVDVATDSTIWSRQFDGEIQRIFEVEEEIAASVLGALEATLPDLAVAPDGFTRPASIDAYSLFLQGNYWWMNGTTGNWFYQARDAFEQAIDLDPNFAEAYGSLAYIYARHDFHDQYMPADIASARAEAAIERALELNDRVIDAYHARAILATSRAEFEKAEQALDRALAIQPNNAVAHYLYSELHLARNQPAQAVASAERALEIDPYSAWVNVNLGIILYHQGDLDAAAAAVGEAIRIDPEYTWAYLWRAVIQHSQGRLAAAVDSMNRCLELDPASETNAAYLGMLHLELMDEENARRWFEYAASLYGDNNAARLHARFLSLVYEREDDEFLLALTGELPQTPHNERYSLIPALHGAAVATGDSARLQAQLLGSAPALQQDNPQVRPQNASLALALAALTRTSAPVASEQLLAAVRASAEQYPHFHARLGLEAQQLLLSGDEAAAIRSLQRTLEEGWIRDWWLISQSPIFDPVRDTPAFRQITSDIRQHVVREAEKRAGQTPAGSAPFSSSAFSTSHGRSGPGREDLRENRHASRATAR